MGHAIFISYRRDDTEGEAGRLYDDLTREFGGDCVFMDVAGISPGVDFRRAIEDNVSSCGVLLAMIGPTWVSISNADGKRRLDDPNDFVALEIASALKRNVPVIPVLVHDSRMPRPEQLPETLQELAFRNSVELTHARWNSDTALLVAALRSYVTPAKITEKDPVHATVSVQLPPPHPTPESAPPPKKSMSPVMIGGIVVAVLALLAVGIAALWPHPARAPQGRWVDPQPRANNSIATVEITTSGNRLLMHAWGNCKAPECDWGTQPAVYDGYTATATFTLAGDATDASRTAMVSLRPNGQNLDVVVQNTFKDQGQSRNNMVHRTFQPAH